MVIELLLNSFAEYLIEFMLLLLVGALFFRYITYRSTKTDDAYFSKFTRELEANMEADKAKHVAIDDPEAYLTNVLGRVNSNLPHRSLRFKKTHGQRDAEKKSFALKEYIGSKHGLVCPMQLF